MAKARLKSLTLGALLLLGGSCMADPEAQIKYNQLGYLPGAEKIAVVPDVAASEFSLSRIGDGAEVFKGKLTLAKYWEPAAEAVKLADFSALKTPGDYRLQVVGAAPVAVHIAANTYDALNAGAIKAYYYNRASTPLLAANAGVYQRAAGHADDHVLIHPSAASAQRPAGTVVAAPKGWYDAGDYNLYVVNSGISTYTLLAAYEQFPAYFKRQNLNIPETGNGVPDILNEAMWNLAWMLAMQDPGDGGVYHKLTSKAFSGFVLPAEDKAERYMVQKATAASLDFAAVMAVASRVYAPYEANYPGLPAKMLAAAKAAYAWAQANPAVYYEQPSDITTGGYGDKDVRDEFAWASAELYIATGDDRYYRAFSPAAVGVEVPNWGKVSSLAWISLAHNRARLTPSADTSLIASRLNSLASDLVNYKKASAYGVPMRASDFIWGSNAVALNQAMMLLAAYQLDTHKRDYLNTAQALLDYVLGRNATGYSFVTGFGLQTPQHIHHRASVADSIPGSIPGFLAGGPNPGQQDKRDCQHAYPSNLPAKAYLDDTCSYASNEIAINWNAPLVYVSAALAENSASLIK